MHQEGIFSTSDVTVLVLRLPFRSKECMIIFIVDRNCYYSYQAYANSFHSD